ncbi:MAG: outer-membrane lipoprotein carrier protein LolA [Treponema sp.]|jgi:outer membrane lipoprotein-sorting protein|nr:outer-membrane lipoprotein carrier protein LolA [Treponema sp.]
MVKRGASLFLLLALNLTVLYGQEIFTAERFLEMVSNNYASMRDYEGDLTIRSSNQDMVARIIYLSPTFLRVDFSRPAEQAIVFNGEVLTVFIPEMRALLSQSVQSRRVTPGSPSSGLSMLRRNYVPSFVTGPNPEPLEGTGERVVRLRLTRRSASEGFREIILSIYPDSLIIRRMEARTIADTEIRFDFTNIRTNVGISETRFVYESPPLANVYHNFLFRD